jgi:hypothetical protein
VTPPQRARLTLGRFPLVNSTPTFFVIATALGTFANLAGGKGEKLYLLFDSVDFNFESSDSGFDVSSDANLVVT